VNVVAVCAVADLPPGQRTIVAVDGRSIGVFNVHGRYYALRNLCPHRRAPLCLGRIRGLISSDGPYDVRVERDGEIIACPWHGWEFDLTTGRSHFNPHRVRVRDYTVTVGATGLPIGTPAAGTVPACAAGESDGGQDPGVETYPVTVEREMVLLHLR
jgi:nitrite reductase/ring-hydroxylating ferredoxin subunit